MLKIAICDNDVNFSGEFENMLYDIKKQEHLVFDLEIFGDGKELVDEICRKGKRYELIFLDIKMKEMDGLTAAKKIRQVDDLTMLIYVTSHESYAVEAYDVQPFQFLVKPIDVDTMHRYFMKAYEKLITGPHYFLCEFNRNSHILRMSDIMYFKSDKRILQTYMVNGEIYKFYDKMNNLEIRLKNEKADFWRIHQSYLVNISYIATITYHQIILKNGETLSISEDRRKIIGEKYCRLYKRGYC